MTFDWKADNPDRLEAHQYPVDDVNVRAAFKNGHGVAFYSLSVDKSVAFCRNQFPDADVYHTSRNGDDIILLVPKGTPAENLPNKACSYIAFRWNT